MQKIETAETSVPQKIKYRYRKKYRKYSTYFLSKFFRFFMGKYKTINMDVIDFSEPFLLVSNHRMAYGPIMNVGITPMQIVPMIDFKMLETKLVREELFNGLKNGMPKWLARFTAWWAGPLLKNIMLGLDPIPVYRDGRILSTLKSVVENLSNGKNVFIMPENWVLSGWEYFRKEVSMIEEGPALIAHLYFKKTGKPLNIYCSLNCKEEHIIRFARIEHFDHKAEDVTSERTRYTHCIYNTLKKLEADNKRDIALGVVKTKRKYIRQEKRELKRKAKHNL